MVELHDYQLLARDFLRERGRAALWLDMGLGKTATVLSALEPRHLPALVVAPKRVAENVWHIEQSIWRPDLRVSVAKGGPSARRAALTDPTADIVTLGRDNLADALGLPFKTIIIDESSGFKNRGSQRWKTMRKIVRQPSTEYVWELTGTPAPNGYLDLWGQVFLLDNGARLGAGITHYRNRYFVAAGQLPNGVITKWNIRPEAADNINALLEDTCLSMESDGRVELPPVTYNTVTVKLPSAVRAAYDTFARDLVVDLRNIFGGQIHTAANAAAMTSRLSQLTAGFMYVDDADLHDGAYTMVHQEKLKALREIIDGTGGSPVLVFYRFKAEAEAILREFPDAHTIDEPDVIARWNAGKIPILLAHPASAGHGLNLQYGGHTIVWTSLDWNLELWEQANARLARQGQTHPVVIHTIAAERTIDGMIQRRLVEKADVQDSLLAYLESPI